MSVCLILTSRVYVIVMNATSIYCLCRSGDAEAEHVGRGARDATLLTRVAEFTAETRWSGIH